MVRHPLRPRPGSAPPRRGRRPDVHRHLATWLYRRGHRVAPEAAPTDLPMNRIPVGRIDGAGDLLLPHLGDTLAWDGERITVESTPDRPITHITPLNDGTEHAEQDCACGPTPMRIEYGDGTDGLALVHTRVRPRDDDT